MRTDQENHERFEERLLQSILDDFDSLTAPPARRLRIGRPLHRRLAWTGGVAAAAALAALAVAITGGGSGSGGLRGAAGSPAVAGHSSPTHFENADYVVHRVERATTEDGGQGMIEYVSSHAPDSETGRPTWTESWSLPGSPTSRVQTLDPDGDPLTASILTRGDAQNESILIDYVDRTWAKLVSPNHPSGDEPTAARAPGTVGDWASELHGELSHGEFQVAGHEAIDGRETIELESTRSGEGTLRLWVDAETFRPVREEGVPAGAGPDSPQIVRNDYRWLPADAAGLKLLDPEAAIPAGFHQVPLATQERLEAALLR